MRLATLLFFAVPLVEMIVLIQVGGIIGPLATVGLVVLTAVCGVWLLKLEGLATLTRVRDKLQRGETPEAELLEGIMLIVGGALLLTPGFVTDGMGFVCLLPGLRRPLAARLIRSAGFSRFQMRFTPGFDHAAGRTIDGEFEPDAGEGPPLADKGGGRTDRPGV